MVAIAADIITEIFNVSYVTGFFVIVALILSLFFAGVLDPNL